MKLNQILEMRRQDRGKHQRLQIDDKNYDRSRPQDYFYEYIFSYDVDSGSFEHVTIDPHEKKHYDGIEEVYEYIADDFGIESHDQKLVSQKPVIWVGYTIGEIESHADQDEDGWYEYVSGEGHAFIVSEVRLSRQQFDALAKKLEEELDKDARAAIEDAHEGRRDAEEYARDPYAYYGLSRSDFY